MVLVMLNKKKYVIRYIVIILYIIIVLALAYRYMKDLKKMLEK